MFTLSWIDGGQIHSVKGNVKSINYLYWALCDGTPAQSVMVLDHEGGRWDIEELLKEHQ